MPSAPFTLRNVDSYDRAGLIAQAQHRILVYAPGLNSAEVAALQEARQNLTLENIHIYLDVSINSFQAGYWHGQPAEAISALIDNLSVHNSLFGRLGLLIVDDLALIFTPPLPKIEAEPAGEEANAVQLNAEMTELLWRSIIVHSGSLEEGEATLSGTDGHEPTELIQIPDRPPVDKKTLDLIAEKQKYIQPLQPDQERLLTSLRNQLKLVRLQVEGHKLQSRTLALPDEIIEILGSDSRQVNEYLRASWRIFTERADKDMQQLQTRLHQQVTALRKTYLKPLGHFGGGLLTKQMPDFQRELSALQETLNEIRVYIHEKVPAYLSESREQLIHLMLERAASRKSPLPQPQLDLFTLDTPENSQRRAAERLVDKVDWPTLDELVGDVQLQWSIDDITQDHLSQPAFIKAVEKAYQIDLIRLMKSSD
jgi:hypothetical protein